MKKNKVFYLVALFSVCLFFTGCINEGCIDLEAVNYDELANHNDGSCYYIANVIFWHNIASADALLASGISHLSYYANDELLGTIQSNICWECYNDPYCGTDGLITGDVIIENAASEVITFECFDQNGNKLWSFDGEIYSNKCAQILTSYAKSDAKCTITIN